MLVTVFLLVAHDSTQLSGLLQVGKWSQKKILQGQKSGNFILSQGKLTF